MQVKDILLCLPLLLASCELHHNLSSRQRTVSSISQEFSSIRKRIVLLPLFNEASRGGPSLSSMGTEEIKRQLSRNTEFVLDPRLEAEFSVPSKHIYSGGGGRLTLLSRKALSSGVHLILYGRITHARSTNSIDDIGFFRKLLSQAETHIEMRAFDVSSNREIFNQIFKGRVRNSEFHFYDDENRDQSIYQTKLLGHAMRIAVRRGLFQLSQVAQNTEWTGRVAKIIGPKIYLSAGRESGIRLGEVMKVITEGTEVYDPETGALIGISKGQVKGTLEIIDYFGPDGAVAILHSGGSIVEGDFVQLY